jgi:DNA-binding HxlR family transcriptional regulator
MGEGSANNDEFPKKRGRKKSRWMDKASYALMLSTLREKPLRFMEICKKAGYTNKNIVSLFIKESRKAGLISEVMVDADDRPVAIAWKITKKGEKVLRLIREIESLTK